jgi:hypothetical protein
VKPLSNKILRNLITEAYTAWRAEQERLRKKFPHVTVPLNPDFMWPYQPTVDTIAQRLNTKAASADQIKKRLLWRMRQVQYPFPPADRKKTRETIYQVVRKHGLQKALLDPKLIARIKLFWFLSDYYGQERRFHDRKQSHHAYPLRFHRDAMKEMARHLLWLEEMAKQNKVSRNWFSQYRPAILKAMLQEASIYCPRIIMGFKSATQIPPVKSAGDMQMDIYKAITAAVPKASNLSDNLAYHLTAVIWSSPSSIRAHKLEPTPAAVSRNIRDRRQ